MCQGDCVSGGILVTSGSGMWSDFAAREPLSFLFEPIARGVLGVKTALSAEVLNLAAGFQERNQYPSSTI